VVGARGQPLQGVSVIAIGSGSDTRSGYELTDQDGQFMLRVIRYAPPPTGDSSSSWVRAVANLGPQESVDSLLVRFRVRPVGAMPDTLRVVITLDVP